jgi:hypothetical protein
MPQRAANAAISRRIDPTPGGVDGNVASNDVATAHAYPRRESHYLSGCGGLTLARMDSAGKQRVAMNEATFRKVNEGLEAGQGPDGLLTFVCECGRLGCNQLIQLTRDEYERVRARPRRFAIVDGHEIPEVETVIDRNDRYIVVEKDDQPEAEIVERTDPRWPLDD